MALTKIQKKKIIEDLKEKLSKQKSVVFVDFSGLNSKEIFDLRNKLKKADGLLKVAKKTLLEIAFKKSKIPIWEKIKEIPGQLALILGFKEGYEFSKIAYEFSQENKNLKILGGFFENDLKDAEEVITLAKLPSREELLANLVGSIAAPISNFNNILKANIKGLIYIIKQIKV